MSEKRASFILRQKNPTAILCLSVGVLIGFSSAHHGVYLADIMKYRGDHLEVSDMESRQRQLDMPEMTIAKQ